MFGATSEKILGFVINSKRIEIDLNKVKEIKEMLVPKTEKEIRGFLGKIQCISKFIAKLTIVYEPIFKLLQKNQPII